MTPREEIGYGLDALVIFRSLQQDPVIRALMQFCHTDKENTPAQIRFYSAMVSALYERADDLTGYLEQIVRALKPLGILRAVRGSGGGYALSKPPSEINMEDVFLHLEGEISPVSCLGRGKVCQREGLCSTRAFWHQLDEHVRDFLRPQTLQNIIESERSCCQDPGEHHVELH